MKSRRKLEKKAQAEKLLAGFATPYPVAQFITLQPVADAQQQIDALQKRIEAAKNIQQLRDRKDPVKLTVIQFNVWPIFDVLKTQIQDLEKSAEVVVKAHLAKHISKNNPCQTLEDWIGMAHFSVSVLDRQGEGMVPVALRAPYTISSPSAL
jgi:wobble nucleotide-excising tRNase